MYASVLHNFVIHISYNFGPVMSEEKVTVNENPIADNRRIAKNTIVLYLRSLILLLISLYTSRVILQTLGVTDYGIVGAVSGAVGMFSMVTNSFISAIGRFVTFELGKGNKEKLNRIFCSSVNVLFILGILVLVLGLTLGLWFLNTKLTIPAERLEAAGWVMCCSLMAMAVNIQVCPYTAVIVAHENMKVFAYMSILEAVLKLGVVFMLLLGDVDKLILYAILQLCVAVIIRIIYNIYCRKKYSECVYHVVIDKSATKEMFGFAGWTALNSVVYTFNKQGIELLINIFFGVIFNAARSIAQQVEGAVNQFVGNFMAAMSPQITKLYASGDKDGMFTLICRGAKFSYFLMLFFAIPIFFEARTIMDLWLGVYPEEAVIFTRFSVLLSLACMFGNTLLTGCYAVGNIAGYSIKVSIVSSMMFIGTYIFYKMGFRVETVYCISFVVLVLMIVVRIDFLKKRIGFPPMMFVNNVVCKSLIVTVPALMLPVLICSFIPTGVLRFLLTITLSSMSTLISVAFIGLTSDERRKVILIIKKRLKG